MVMGRKEVAVDFITRLKDKGFKDLDKSTKKSIKSLQKFGRTLGVALSTAALVAFVKKSAQQFAELERSTRKLESELNTLGLAFATSLATDFTRSLALATGTSQDKLIPSLQKLVQTTYTLTDAQKLLGLAVEISGRKGLELEQVTNALSRAFVGDFNALVKLRIGFEKAELEGKNFEDVLVALQGEFGVKQADTFAEKIDKLKVAFEETQVAIGRGLIKGLEDSGLSIEQTQQKMIELGEKIGEALGKAAAAVLTLENKLEALASNPVIRFLLDALDALVGLDPFGPAARAAEKETDARRRAADAYTKQLENAGKAVKLAERENELVKIRVADLAKLKREDKKRATEKKRNEKLERLRNAISFKFDIDAINLQAALKRNLSAKDKERVLQLSALKISDYQKDEEAIKTLEAATQGRYDEAMNLEAVYQLLKDAGFASDEEAIKALTELDPTITFTNNLDDIIAKLQKLISGTYTIPITFQSIGVPPSFDPGKFKKKDEDTSKDLPVPPVPPPVIKPPGIDLPGEIGGEPSVAAKSLFPDIAAFRFFEENQSSSLRNLYDSTDVPSNFDPALFRMFEETGRTGRGMEIPDFFDPGSFRRRDEGVTINLSVSGSLISQNDLVAAVTDAVYTTQRSGNNLLIAD